jgi:DNA polymerase III alpha subunit (gram-positive type)
MKQVLVIDLETTGLACGGDEITEFAAAIYVPEKKRIVRAQSVLINGNKLISKEIEAMTMISHELRNTFGVHESFLQEGESFLHWASNQYIVAHNAYGMEMPWLESRGITFPKSQWIDTSVDIPYPKHITTRKLSYLASEHGIPLVGAHEAINDVITTIEILKKYDFEEILKYKAAANVTLVANVSYEQRDKAKAHGFRWDAETKRWFKIIKEFEIEEQKKALDFRFGILQDGEKIIPVKTTADVLKDRMPNIFGAQEE